jgi:lipoprotein-anchoring transpeptidase ErfK/SrfK
MRCLIIVAAAVTMSSSTMAWAEPMSLAPPDSAPEGQRTVAMAPASQAQPGLGGGFIEFLFGGSAPRPRDSSRTWYGEPSRRDYYGRELTVEPTYASRGPVDPRSEQQAYGDQMDPSFLRQEVAYPGAEKPGTIVVDTPNHFLYLVETEGRALRYGIGVGRPGFTWAGVHAVSAKKEWPDWVPPDEMLKRQPYLPHFVAGGPNNPLGARALYLGSTMYRIHGSNEPWTIGRNVSSGCIRMRNVDVIDLYERVKVGAKVVVL